MNGIPKEFGHYGLEDVCDQFDFVLLDTSVLGHNHPYRSDPGEVRLLRSVFGDSWRLPLELQIEYIHALTEFLRQRPNCATVSLVINEINNGIRELRRTKGCDNAEDGKIYEKGCIGRYINAITQLRDTLLERVLFLSDEDGFSEVEDGCLGDIRGYISRRLKSNIISFPETGHLLLATAFALATSHGSTALVTDNTRQLKTFFHVRRWTRYPEYTETMPRVEHPIEACSMIYSPSFRIIIEEEMQRLRCVNYAD